MKRRTVILGIAICLLFFQAMDVQAKGLYVRDWITISVRTSPRENAKITALANTNDYLEVIGEREHWTKVRTTKGREGWVLSRYLTEETPKALIVNQLSEKNQSLSDSIRTLRDENKQLQKENRSHKYKISSLTKEVEKSKKDYTKLKDASASYLDLKDSYEKIIETDKVRQTEMETLSKENRKLKTSERLIFTLIGGGFIILGLVFGMFMQSLRSRPKKSGYKF